MSCCPLRNGLSRKQRHPTITNTSASGLAFESDSPRISWIWDLHGAQLSCRHFGRSWRHVALMHAIQLHHLKTLHACRRNALSSLNPCCPTFLLWERRAVADVLGGHEDMLHDARNPAAACEGLACMTKDEYTQQNLFCPNARRQECKVCHETGCMCTQSEKHLKASEERFKGTGNISRPKLHTNIWTPSLE